MRRRHFSSWAVLGIFALVFSTAKAQETFSEPMSGKIFPTQISFHVDGREYSLQLTGATQTKREKKTGEITALFTLAHYIEASKPDSTESKFEIILHRPVAKQMLFDFDQATSAEHLKKIYARFFSKALRPGQQDSAKAAIEEFMSSFSKDLEAGQRLAIRWLPDGRLSVVMPEGTEKILEKSEIGTWLWHSWFGEASRLDRFTLVERMAL